METITKLGIRHVQFKLYLLERVIMYIALWHISSQWNQKTCQFFRAPRLNLKCLVWYWLRSCCFFVFRFSQFFISPLLRENAVEREIKAVDSGMIKIFVSECAKNWSFLFSFQVNGSFFVFYENRKKKVFWCFQGI